MADNIAEMVIDPPIADLVRLKYSGAFSVEQLLEQAKKEIHHETNRIGKILIQHKSKIATIAEASVTEEEEEQEIEFPPRISQLKPSRERKRVRKESSTTTTTSLLVKIFNSAKALNGRLGIGRSKCR